MKVYTIQIGDTSFHHLTWQSLQNFMKSTTFKCLLEELEKGKVIKIYYGE